VCVFNNVFYIVSCISCLTRFSSPSGFFLVGGVLVVIHGLAFLPGSSLLWYIFVYGLFTWLTVVVVVSATHVDECGFFVMSFCWIFAVVTVVGCHWVKHGCVHDAMCPAIPCAFGVASEFLVVVVLWCFTMRGGIGCMITGFGCGDFCMV